MTDRTARSWAGVIALGSFLAMIPPLYSAAQTHGGFWPGLWSLVRFFTIITNTLVGIGFGLIAWKGRAAVSPRLLGAIVLAIALVGVVFNLLLGGLVHATIWDVLGDKVHHLIAPIAVPLWWLVYAPHGRLSWKDPFVWALYPLAYSGYVIARVALQDDAAPLRYPYFFMDVDRLGWATALLNMTAIAAGFVAAGLAAVWLDRRLGTRAPAKEGGLNSPPTAA